jgi:hypothetical protein
MSKKKQIFEKNRGPETTDFRRGRLGSARPRLGKNGTDESIQPCVVRGDRTCRLSLLADQCKRNLGEAALDPFVHGHRAADESADTCVDFGVESAGIAAGNLDTGQLAGTTRGQMFTP